MRINNGTNEMIKEMFKEELEKGIFETAISTTTASSTDTESKLDMDVLLEMAKSKEPPKQQMIIMDADMMRSLSSRPEFREIEEKPRSMFMGAPVYGVEKVVKKETVQRRHKKKRINKKLNKKYGPKVKTEWIKNPTHGMFTMGVQA